MALLGRPFIINITNKRRKKTNRNKTFFSTKEKVRTTVKLNYNSQRELAKLPDLIESLEQEIELLTKEISQPQFYQQENKVIKEKNELLKNKQQQLQQAYQRWEELEP